MQFDFKQNRLLIAVIVLGVLVFFVSKSNFSFTDWFFDKLAEKIEERHDGKRPMSKSWLDEWEKSRR